MGAPSPPLSTRWAVIAGVGCLLVWLAILYRFGPGREGRDHRPPDFLTPPPADRIGRGWVIRDLEGRAVPFDRFRGRALLLNFWAPSCGPCLEEMPSIDRLAVNPRLKDVAILCVSTEDDREGIAEVSARLKMHVPLYRPDGPEAIVPFASGPRPIEILPTTYLIAPDGRIAFAQEGAAQWDDPGVVDLLERLSGEKPPVP